MTTSSSNSRARLSRWFLRKSYYSYSKLAGEMLLASSTRAYGIRTYVTRPGAIYTPERRHHLAHHAAAATVWDPWLWCWVGSEDVANAHRLLMEHAENLPLLDTPHG